MDCALNSRSGILKKNMTGYDTNKAIALKESTRITINEKRTEVDIMENQQNIIGRWVREQRKKAGLTQKEFALRSGLGLRFVRDLEQGKNTVRMDKVNQALWMFGAVAAPVRQKDLKDD